MNFTFKNLIHTAILGALLLGVAFSFFALATPNAEAQVNNDTVNQRRAQLQAELEQIERDIQAQSGLLSEKQKERSSLERDIAILDAQIAKERLALRQRDLTIQSINSDINEKLFTIGDLSNTLSLQKESLAQLIRKTDRIDDMSMVEIILSKKSLSDFFAELDSFQQIKSALRDSFWEIEQTREETEAAKSALEQKRSDEVELRNLQDLQKKRIEDQEKEKQRILSATRGEENRYQTLIQQKERSAAEIRSELFALRDSAAIPFGEAVELATIAGNATRVRPALVLGVLKQETRLGEFLGTGVWTSDMHPTRDQPLFQVITATLGYNPGLMPVSKQPSYGWGGAMGPAQFIPSTWACYGGYINTNTGDCNNASRSMGWDAFWAGPWQYVASKDRIRNFLKKNSPSDPWRNADAFTASATLLKDNGADAGTFATERRAALRYFAGWTNASNPAYAFYGDSVMEHASVFQKQIDILAGN